MNTNPLDALPLPLARQLDKLCDRFDAAWRAAADTGERPRLEPFVAEVPQPERTVAVRELLAIEVEYRRQAGETPHPREYQERFPTLDRGWLAEFCSTPSTPIPAPDGVAAMPVFVARQSVGKFQLLGRVGGGAFGTVWRAHDTELNRVVALKVPHPGLLEVPEYRERFQREARAAAQLRHPGIVTVFEVAALDGQPVLVSDFIEGRPLRDLIREKRWPFREAAALVAKVAEALDYAHGMGVVHRDVKPANILLERTPTAEDAENTDKQAKEDPASGTLGAGNAGPTLPGSSAALSASSAANRCSPRLADFGLALCEGAGATLTQEGQLIGTPAYMSPEQAAGQGHSVDRRSDVYSLGVVLYELLTGEVPFRGSKSLLVEQILHAEVRPPRRLNASFPRDLETVCLKCLAKDPARRYPTARELADDLRRFLAGEPVRARPVGRLERSWRWCRRNPLVAGLAASVMLAILVALAGTSWGLVRAERAAEGEKKAKEAAQDREAETRAVLDFVKDKIFAAARPEGQEGGLGHEVKLRDAVKAALPFVDKSFQDQPLVEARLRHTLGLTFSYLGDHAEAAEQHERARALYTRHRGPDHPHTLMSMHNLASSYEALNRHAEALHLREEALAAQKRVLSPDHPDTLAGMNNLASSYEALNRHAEALKLREEALAARKRVPPPDHPDTLASMNSLASSYYALNRHAEALKLREEALAAQKRVLPPDHPHTLDSMMGLATSYAALNRPAEALKLREEALEAQKRVLPPDHPHTLMSMNNVAISYAALKRHADAVKLYEEALAAQKRVLPPDHPDTLRSMNNLASSYLALNRPAEAVKLYEETLAARKRVLPPDHPHTLNSMYNLAISYAALNRPAEAVKLYEETLAARKRVLPPDHPDTLMSMHNLASRYYALNRHAEALKLREETLAARKRVLPPDHPHTLMSMHNLASSYAELNRPAEALPLLDEFLAKADRSAVDPQLIPLAITLRLTCYQKLGDVAGCRATAELLEKCNPADAESLYTAARCRAVTAALQAQAKEPDAARLAQQDADMAMAWLTKAVAAGYKNAEHMKKDSDLDVLRGRDDFRSLLAELEKE